jgi:hypothetical protein
MERRMYKIFCIPESKYLCALFQYQKSTEYVNDGDRLEVTIERTGLRPMMVINGQHPIFESPTNPGTLRYDSRFYIREHISFVKYKDLSNFIRVSFNPSFIFVYKDGQFREDSPNYYANPIDFGLPPECFEIHEVTDNGNLIGTAPLCVCIPTKASK